MFSILTDEDGNILSEEDLRKMRREDLILLLSGHIKKMTYLKEEDRKILLSMTSMIQNAF